MSSRQAIRSPPPTQHQPGPCTCSARRLRIPGFRNASNNGAESPPPKETDTDHTTPAPGNPSESRILVVRHQPTIRAKLLAPGLNHAFNTPITTPSRPTPNSRTAAGPLQLRDRFSVSEPDDHILKIRVRRTVGPSKAHRLRSERIRPPTIGFFCIGSAAHQRNNETRAVSRLM